MRETLPAILRCPSCGREGDWELSVGERDAREVRDGHLRCRGCGSVRLVRDGIVDLLHEPPDFVTREAAGLGRFAELMARDGWDRERVLQLPDVELGYWHHQAVGMRQVLESPRTAPWFQPGVRILDVGANTCWASAAFAERGLDVVALDISTHEMQGLRTADWWFEDKDVYFERVLSVMFAPALATASFDLVFACEVLHHNHRANLDATFRELHRILRPGGRIVVINEPVRALRSPKLRQGAGEVAEYEGHEHAYLRATYVRAARRAGFDVEVLAPRLIRALDGGTWGLSPDTTTARGFRMAIGHAVRRNALARRAHLAWKTYVDGVSAYLVATKPPAGHADARLRTPAAGIGAPNP